MKRELPLRGVRRTAILPVQGETLDELQKTACVHFDRIFGGRAKYEIIEVRASPEAQTMGGWILLWEGIAEAGEVWG